MPDRRLSSTSESRPRYKGCGVAHNDELHAAVLAAPDDDEPRLVYADWLLAQGDPRGELIIVQVELARCEESARRAELEQRERELWAAHGSAWRPPVYSFEYDRGFITRMFLDEGAIESGLDAMLEGACLRSLRIYGGSGRPRAIDGLAARIDRMALRELELQRVYSISQGLLERLGASLASRSLESLRFNDGSLKAVHTSELARALYFGGLRSLELHRCWIGPGDVAELGWWRHPRALRRLSLSDNPLGPGALANIMDAPAFAALEQLDLGDTDLGVEDALAIVAAKLPLVELDLHACTLGPAAAQAIARAPHFASLRRLVLTHTEIGPDGLAALVASPHLDRELELVIDGDVLGLEYETIWDQGTNLSEWLGEPPAQLRERFRVQIGGWPGFVSQHRMARMRALRREQRRTAPPARRTRRRPRS